MKVGRPFDIEILDVIQESSDDGDYKGGVANTGMVEGNSNSRSTSKRLHCSRGSGSGENRSFFEINFTTFFFNQ